MCWASSSDIPEILSPEGSMPSLYRVRCWKHQYSCFCWGENCHCLSVVFDLGVCWNIMWTTKTLHSKTLPTKMTLESFPSSLPCWSKVWGMQDNTQSCYLQDDVVGTHWCHGLVPIGFWLLESVDNSFADDAPVISDLFYDKHSDSIESLIERVAIFAGKHLPCKHLCCMISSCIL